MKITILTYGSRGDVQPFIPLSLGLMARGHSVKVAAPLRFQPLIEEHKIAFVPLAGEPAELSRQLNDAGRNFIKIFRELMDYAVKIGSDVFRQTEEVCKNADLIIHTFMHAVGAHTLAREMNIPDIHIQLFPVFTPTGDYPNVTIPDLRLRFLNRLTHLMTRGMMVWGSKYGFEQVRRRAGLPNRKLYSPFDKAPVHFRMPILCAWSPRVLPASNDWSLNTHVTDYFFGSSDGEYQPTPDLQSFLQEGEAPVCISFGSMVNRESAKIDQIVREAVQQTKNRAILLSGWGGITNQSSKQFLYVDEVPHQWLLPHC